MYAQPPGPGLPLQAPSVKSLTRSAGAEASGSMAIDPSMTRSTRTLPAARTVTDPQLPPHDRINRRTVKLGRRAQYFRTTPTRTPRMLTWSRKIGFMRLVGRLEAEPVLLAVDLLEGGLAVLVADGDDLAVAGLVLLA